MEKLKMGLIGCGGMMATHAQAVNMVDTIEIVAVCDIIPANAQKVAEVLNNPYITTDYRTMVDKVDAVLIALPHDLHYECGMFFARHKKHVLMEKPLCNSEEECISLIETCEAMGVTLMCAYPVRFKPGIMKLKELVDSGEYGKVIQMSIWTEQLTGADWPTDGVPNWAATARLGGGQLFSHGCHYVDLLLWFLGDPVKGCHFGTKVGTPWMMREGTSVLTMTFENGALGYHGATWGARGTRLGYDFQIQMEKAMLEYENDSSEIRVYNSQGDHKPGVEDRDNKKYSVIWKQEGGASKQTQYEIAHFAECVRTGATPLTNGWDTLQGLRVIWKTYEAEKTNTVADLRGLGLKMR